MQARRQPHCISHMGWHWNWQHEAWINTNTHCVLHCSGLIRMPHCRMTIHVRVGHLRFCTANILASGNCFFDLMLHAARYIYANIRVVYQRQPSYFFVRSFVGWFVCLFVCLFCFVLFWFVCLFVLLGWVGLG